MEQNKEPKNKLLKLIFEVLKIYKNNFDGITYKLYTNCNDQIEIEFPKEKFIKFSHLDLIKDFSEKFIKELDSNGKEAINNICSKFINMGNITLEKICCLIDFDGKTYMVIKKDLGMTIFVLKKNQDNKFMVTDIKNIRYLYNLIKSSNSKIYFPTKLEIFKNDDKIYSESLSKNKKKNKLLNIKEALYLDKDGNVRQENKISMSYFCSKIS